MPFSCFSAFFSRIDVILFSKVIKSLSKNNTCTKQINRCSESTEEKTEKSVKYVQS